MIGRTRQPVHGTAGVLSKSGLSISARWLAIVPYLALDLRALVLIAVISRDEQAVYYVEGPRIGAVVLRNALLHIARFTYVYYLMLTAGFDCGYYINA